MSQSIIWNTAAIEETKVKLRKGAPVDLSCFHERDPDLRGKNVLFEMTPEEQEEFIRCSSDIIYFVETYCQFLTDQGRRTVELREYQEDILDTIGEEEYDEETDDFIPSVRNYILMASRQTGKTTTIAAYFAWYLCFHTDRNLTILANKQATTTEIVNKVTQVFRGLPYFLKPGIDYIGKLGLGLDNGCMLSSQATTGTAQIGFTIHVLYIDEFAHIRQNIARPFWRSVYPTLSSSKVSQCIITSTPNGMQNLFYEIWDKSVRGENSFANKRVDYWEVKEHDEIWAAKMKKDFGEEEFAQEFELKFDSASNNLLTARQMKWIKKLSSLYDYEWVELENTDLDSGLYDQLRWRTDFDPNYDFNDKEHRFVVSIDLAEGKDEEELKDNDYNVAQIHQVKLKTLPQLRRLRRDEHTIENLFRIEQVGVYQDNIKDETNLAKVCQSLVFDQIKNPDLVKMVIEMNFNGKAFLNEFSSHDDYYEDCVMHSYHTAPVPGERKPRKKAGFKQRKDKDHFCRAARKLIGGRTLIVNEKKTVKEFGSFGKVKGKWKGIASHDDLAMAEINIARLLEEPEYSDWLYDFLEALPDTPEKRLALKILEEPYDNSDVGDDMFSTLYGVSEQEGIKEIFKNVDRTAGRYKPGSSMLGVR